MILMSEPTVYRALTLSEAHELANNPSQFTTPTDHALWCKDPCVFFRTHDDAAEFLLLHPDLRMFEGAEKVNIVQSFLGYTFAPVGKKTRLDYPVWALPKEVFPEEEIPNLSEEYIRELCSSIGKSRTAWKNGRPYNEHIGVADESAFDRFKYLACCGVASKGKLGAFSMPRYYHTGSRAVGLTYKREDGTCRHFLVSKSGRFDWDYYLYHRTNLL